MSDMQDYKSSLSDASSRKFETFSYLPKMTDEQIRSQIEYIVSKGWNPGIEHCEPENAFQNYWYMWNVDAILAECEACHKAHPNNHVRLMGFDNYAQSAGASMVIFRGKAV